MKPTEKLGTTTSPDGSVVALYRHDGDYLMLVDGIELMSTRRVSSEVTLATLACEPLRRMAGASVLIGGLGFGFTLRAALALLAADARVVVAELLRDVIAWNLNPAWALAGDAMHDARVTVKETDVYPLLRESVGAFDAIMLDVDNGAESFTTGSNKKLYGKNGIRTVMAALRPGGRVTYWSADTEPAFVHALKCEGFDVSVHRVRSHDTSGGFNSVIAARRRLGIVRPSTR